MLSRQSYRACLLAAVPVVAYWRSATPQDADPSALPPAVAEAAVPVVGDRTAAGPRIAGPQEPSAAPAAAVESARR